MHDVALLQGRAHHLLHELHVARDVEQQLRLRHQLEVARVAAQGADGLGHRRRVFALRADVPDRQAARVQRGRDLVRQRCLAAAIDAFEDDKHQNVTPSCASSAK